MGGLIAGLGAVARGLNSGIDIAQEREARRKSLAWQDEQQGRQRQQWSREDAMQADLDAARAAAQKTMQGFQQQAAGNTGAPNQYATMGGSDGSTPDGMGPAANDMAPQQPAAFRPSLQQTLKAQEAFTDELFRRGQVDKGVEHWLQGEGQRVKLRQTIAQPALVAVSAGGDATGPLKAFYDTIDDGYDLVSAAPTKGLDGKVTYNVQRVNRATGKEETLSLDQQQIANVIQQSVADPKMAAEYALKLKLEAFKGDVEQKNIESRGEQARKTEGVKYAYGLADNADKARLKLGEVAARGAEERKSIGARTGGELQVVRERARLDASKPYTLGAEDTLMVNEPQPDGSIKPKPIAKGGGKVGNKVADAQRINNMVISNFGILDPGTGRQVGSAQVDNISAAVGLLLQENPDMDPNAAIAKAARDLGFNATPKK